VNRVTPKLFQECQNPEEFYTISPERLEALIYSTGFYKNKAKSIRGFCRMLVEDYRGIIPRDMESLLKMPGFGRKTANVILQELYGVAAGIVVDTHVARLSKRLGLTSSRDPVKIERDLMAVIPKEYWIDWSLFMIFLGRSCCTAKRVDCEKCVLKELCPSGCGE
jgi:endonuclease-3